MGAIPQKTNLNSQLNYALNWSTEGLIEQYSKAVTVIENGKKMKKPPLQDYEIITLFNKKYEAFNTSGELDL